MKSQLLAATALVSALLLSAPANATAPASKGNRFAYSGVLDIQTGYRHMSNSDDTVKDGHWTLGGNGRISFPVGDMLSVQADVQGEWFDVQDESTHTPSSNALVGAHFSARDPGRGLFGVFAAAGFPSQLGKDHDPNVPDHSLKWEAGIEGQVYWNNFTFYAQGGFADMQEDKGGDHEGFLDGEFARGVVRYFINDDTMVNAEYSWGRTDQYIDDDDAGRFTNWGIGGAMRLPFTPFARPVYGTLAYQSGKYDSTTEGAIGKDYSMLAGVKFMFGASGNLKHNDRHGATLDLPMLPVRATSWTESLD